MPINFNIPDEHVEIPLVGGIADGIVVSSTEGIRSVQAAHLTDIWIEKVIHLDGTEDLFGQDAGGAKPSWLTGELEALPDDPDGTKRYNYGLTLDEQNWGLVDVKILWIGIEVSNPIPHKFAIPYISSTVTWDDAFAEPGYSYYRVTIISTEGLDISPSGDTVYLGLTEIILYDAEGVAIPSSAIGTITSNGVDFVKGNQELDSVVDGNKASGGAFMRYVIQRPVPENPGFLYVVLPLLTKTVISGLDYGHYGGSYAVERGARQVRIEASNNNTDWIFVMDSVYNPNVGEVGSMKHVVVLPH